MKSKVLLCFFTCGLFFTPIFSQSLGREIEDRPVFPSLDLIVPSPLPKNFRMMTKPFSKTEGALPPRDGLDLLEVSASGQFTSTNLILMLNKLPEDKPIVIVDLREESHGFLHGIPISWKLPDTTWTNKGMTLWEITQDEKRKLKQILDDNEVLLDPHTDPIKLSVTEVMTEKELVESEGLHYVRIPITENHKPTLLQVDALVSLILNKPQDCWLHIHCHGGRGRTTTFLIMYDMIVNARYITFEDILSRQTLIGGTDMYKPIAGDDPKFYPVTERLLFLREFYQYCIENDVSQISYSHWKKLIENSLE